MSEIEIMEEVKKSEKTAVDFLKKDLKIPNPTPDQLDIMTRIVVSNNGTKTLSELHHETKEVLLGKGFFHPEKKRVLNWMLAIAVNRSVSPDDKLAGIA